MDYTLTVNGVTQQYTGASVGGMGPGSGGQPPELPDGQQPPEKPDGSQAPGDNGQQPPEKPDGGDQQDRPQPPENGGQAPDGQPGESQDSQTEPSTQFTLTGDHHAFSGISDSSNS